MRRLHHKFCELGMCVIIAACLFFPQETCGAQKKYRIVDHESKLFGKIHYSLVGVYKAKMDGFKGDIFLDLNDIRNSTISLIVPIANIDSGIKWMDRVVKSDRFLNAKEFPEAVFKSQKIWPCKEREAICLTGELFLRGKTRVLDFSFQLSGPIEDENGQYFKASGRWPINRKDFGIVWHKFLDHGGIIVGNHVELNWDIVLRDK